MLKFTITTKILLALLGLSLISLVIVGYSFLRGLINLGNISEQTSITLGDKAVTDSKEALQAQAEMHLIKLAKNQAALSNALLEKVESEVNAMVKFASSFWNDPSIKGQRKS